MVTTGNKSTRTGPRTIRLSPRRALKKVRKPLAQATRVEEGARRYRRAEARRATREIVVEESEGC